MILTAPPTVHPGRSTGISFCLLLGCKWISTKSKKSPVAAKEMNGHVKEQSAVT
jgi:hypothetical protein